MDASAQYTWRSEEDDFKIGDLVTVGTAFAWRFTEDMQTFPRFSAFLELNARHLFRNEEDGENVRNSGGTALFVTPGVRLAISDRTSFQLAVAIPVLQHLHKEQQETMAKVSFGLTLSW
jgi:hypothetical protein